MPDLPDHDCTYPPNGFMEPAGNCVTCGQPPVRTVEVREAFLRAVLRDALVFAQAVANDSGNPEARQVVAEYETALLDLTDAPAALKVEASAAAVIASLESKLAEAVGALVRLASPEMVTCPGTSMAYDPETDGRMLIAAGVLESIARLPVEVGARA